MVFFLGSKCAEPTLVPIFTISSEATEHASQSVPMVSTSTPGLSAPAGPSGVEDRDDIFLDAGDR